MNTKTLHLSERLQSLADMVPQGKRVVDVGCDHGFVSIYLVQSGKSPHVLAMDVREGPLFGAREHVAEYGLVDYIETRISDGLMNFSAGEADVCICAGMGGRLMMKLLTESREKVKGLDALILQPQSELPVFRRFLREEGFQIQDENILFEEGKYYFVMKAVPVNGKVKEDMFYDTYSRILLEKKHPVMRKYLVAQKKATETLKDHLLAKGGDRAAKRLWQVENELRDIEKALNYFNEMERPVDR